VVNNNDLDLLDPEEQQQQQQEAQPPQAAVQQLPQDFAVVVDAADTPRRLGDVLTSLREAGAKRVFTVFGCDGQVGLLGPGNWLGARCARAACDALHGTPQHGCSTHDTHTHTHTHTKQQATVCAPTRHLRTNR
jgi:hypothetical protein